jgi:hypothetical protein
MNKILSWLSPRQPPFFEIRHRLLAHLALQHSRQIPAPCTTRIIHIAGLFLRTVSGQFIEPIDDLAITATLIDEAGEAVAAIAPALLTTHAQQIELANEIAEDDCAVAGHCGQ